LWAVTTITTVGYGDRLALLGTVTAVNGNGKLTP
jgi:hypothetical protein